MVCVSFGEPPESQAKPGKIHIIVDSKVFGIRRRHRHQGRQHSPQSFEGLLKPEVIVAIVLGNRQQFTGSTLGIFINPHRLSGRMQREHANGGPRYLKSLLVEPHVSKYLVLNRLCSVEHGWTVEPRMNFFRYKTATDEAAALEHECRVT